MARPTAEGIADVVPESSRYDAVWQRAEPYMRARKNDVHVPLSFDWCAAPAGRPSAEADRDIVSLAILLHDIGWYSIDMETSSKRALAPT
jgi:hypothetical protein